MTRVLTIVALTSAMIGALASASGAAAETGTAEHPEIVVTGTSAPFLAKLRAPDWQLATMRGGFLLPNGFDVAVGIDIQTRVDGILVLHTLFSSEGPMSGTRVYTDGTDGTRLAPGTVVVTSSGSGVPVIVTDRSPTGTTIAVTPMAASATVNLVNGAQSTWVTASGQTEVPVTANGAPVTTGPGTFSLASGANGNVVTLDTGDLQIRHLVGQATGSVIANMGNDRTIDTVSSVNIDLMNSSSLLANSGFANDLLALELVRHR